MDSQIKKNKKEYFFVVVGMLLGLLACIPYFIMGENSVVTYHDQLDGELITYLLNAKHLFQKVSVYQELMNGIPTTGMVSPAVLFVPLYAVLRPFTAFLVTQVLIIQVGFVSMFLLIKEITGNARIAFLTGLAFMFLPFYPVYGFCIIGQPMLWYALLRLKRGEGKLAANIVIIVIYTFGSSLALVGFSLILFTGVWTVYEFVKKNPGKWKFLYGTLTLIFCYAITNLNLISQLLGYGNSTISHKSEMVIKSLPLIKHCLEIFFIGTDYAKSCQLIILPLSFVAVLVVLVSDNKEKKCRKDMKILGFLYGVLIIISILCGFYQSAPVAEFRNQIGGVIKEFNLERIAWVMPVVWFAILGISMKLLEENRSNRLKTVLYQGISLLIVALLIFFSLYKSDIKLTTMKMLKGDSYYAITWKQFFATDLFAEIKEDIGLSQEEYRVVSFGIYPSTAAYNGFYCLDAYSNNYSLDYKHEFRKIIAPELDKSEYLRMIFDEWGNRCYITSSESMDYYTFERRWTPVTQNLSIDVEQLKTMGCRYIISASYLYNAEELGLSMLKEDAYENDHSWYRLYVYCIN